MSGDGVMDKPVSIQIQRYRLTMFISFSKTIIFLDREHRPIITEFRNATVIVGDTAKLKCRVTSDDESMLNVRFLRRFNESDGSISVVVSMF